MLNLDKETVSIILDDNQEEQYQLEESKNMQKNESKFGRRKKNVKAKAPMLDDD